MHWRTTWWEHQDFDLCHPIHLSEGLLLLRRGKFLQFIEGATYTPQCFMGRVPMMNLVMGYMLEQYSDNLPLVLSSWKEYVGTTRGHFLYSFTTLVYSISVLAVITLFLTVFVFTNYTIKPLMLLKLLLVLLLSYILGVVIKSITVLHGQQKRGYLHGGLLQDSLNNTIWLSILDLIAVFLLQINQVQVVMRIFQRQKEKRMAFLVGVVCAGASQTIWGVTKFKDFAEDDEAGDILPAFIYLVRIAMAVCYAAIVLVFMLTKIHDIYQNPRIWVLSLLTFVLIYSPVAFFVADVSNAFIYELSEVFSVVTYVICVVLPWEWCNKVNIIKHVKEKEGVLGRRFYEEEQLDVDHYEIFEDRLDNDDDETNESEDLLGRRARIKQRFADSDLVKIKDVLHHSKRTLLNVTDGIIAAGFLIPRSASIATDDIPLLSSPSIRRQNRRNVYVYLPRQVNFEVIDNE